MRRLGAERVSLGGERCTEPCLAHQQLDMQAVLLSGGYQILQRTAPPHTHTHWCGLASWHEPLGPLRLKLAQAKALAAGQVRRGGGCPGALWNSGAELGPKALRHAFDHKNGGGGGQSLFLESSKAGDFCGLVQSLALVPLAPSRATFSCTQAPPTDV